MGLTEKKKLDKLANTCFEDKATKSVSLVISVCVLKQLSQRLRSHGSSAS